MSCPHTKITTHDMQRHRSQALSKHSYSNFSKYEWRNSPHVSFINVQKIQWTPKLYLFYSWLKMHLSVMLLEDQGKIKTLFSSQQILIWKQKMKCKSLGWARGLKIIWLYVLKYGFCKKLLRYKWTSDQCWSGKKVKTKVLNWSEVHLYQSNFLQNPYCGSNSFPQIIQNFINIKYIHQFQLEICIGKNEYNPFLGWLKTCWVESLSTKCHIFFCMKFYSSYTILFIPLTIAVTGFEWHLHQNSRKMSPL